MSLSRFHLTIVSTWFVALIAVFAVRIILGVTTSPAEGVGLILLASVPALIMLAVFRGAPPQTIAEVLHDTERSPVTR